MHTSVEVMPASLTYQFRIVAWTPVHPTIVPSAGVMTITEAKSPTAKKHIGRYAVLELVNPDGRQFKLTKPGGSGVYYVFYSRTRADECTCLGFEAAGYCKHAEAIRLLIDRHRMASSKPGRYPLTSWSDLVSEEQTPAG